MITSNLTLLFDLLKPVCSPYELLLVGGGQDGSYLLPNDFVGITDCFSPGGCTYKYFEDHLAKRMSISTHICDLSSDLQSFTTPFIDGLQTFEKKWLSDVSTSTSLTLDEWVDKYTADMYSDLILQMDIEGSEYQILNSVASALLKRFRIVVIELHDLTSVVSHYRNAESMLSAISRLRETHSCIHIRPNNATRLHHHEGKMLFEPVTYANIPDILEATFIRNDRLSSKCGTPYLPQIPHPKEIYGNVLLNPPLHLNEAWLHPHTRSSASKAKINKDYLVHYYTSAKYAAKHLPSALASYVASLFNLE